MALSRLIEVETGRVRSAVGNTGLRCSALGSCIAVAALDPVVRVGGIAHVMLPGAPAGTGGNRNRYAQPAVKALMRALTRRGASVGRLVVCLAGGANVLRRPGETLPSDITASVKKELKRYGIAPLSCSVGGVSRRSITLGAAQCSISCTVGDGAGRTLWSAHGTMAGGPHNPIYASGETE